MSRLAELMDRPFSEVSKLIHELEALNGYPSHDVRQLAKNHQLTREKILDLGMDPGDTTAAEFYYALCSKYEADSLEFEIYHRARGMNFDEKIQKVIQILESKQLPSVWCIKPTALKNLLASLPPKHTAKYLNYRSVNSLLKRQSISEIMLAARYIEPASWQKNFARRIKKLSHADLEIREVQLTALNYHKWSNVTGPSDHIAFNEDVGALGVWPADELKNAPLLSIVLLIIERLQALGLKDLTFGGPESNSILRWWADSKGLISCFEAAQVSANIHDVSKNTLKNNKYENGVLANGRQNFWHELISQYDNHPEFDGLTESLGNIKKIINKPAPNLAYELAEYDNG